MAARFFRNKMASGDELPSTSAITRVTTEGKSASYAPKRTATMSATPLDRFHHSVTLALGKILSLPPAWRPQAAGVDNARHSTPNPSADRRFLDVRFPQCPGADGYYTYSIVRRFLCRCVVAIRRCISGDNENLTSTPPSSTRLPEVVDNLTLLWLS